MIKNILMNSLSYEDFLNNLESIIKNSMKSDEFFLASFNALKIVKELNLKKIHIEKNKKVKFIIYKNNEVMLYTGSNETLKVLEKKFNISFKELKRKTALGA